MKIPYSPTRSVTVDSGVPAYDNRRGAPDEAFGAGLGRATQGLGQSVDRLGDSLTRFDLISKADAVERDNLNRSTDYVQFTSEEQERLATMKREATGTDANGFLDNYVKGLDQRINSRLATVRPQEREKWKFEYEKLRSTQHRSAFGSEMEIRDATQTTRMKSSFDTLGKQIEDNPTARDTYIENGNKVIDASAQPPAVKEQLKKNWKEQATYIYGSAMAKKDPTAVAEALDPEGNYFRRLRVAESGGVASAKNPNSSARGLYQFIDSTWKNLVESPEGKSAGLTMDGRGNAEQEDRAIRIFTKQNDAKLKSAGFDVNSGNRYAMHFLGEAGGIKFLREARENPGASAASIMPAAAEANRTIFYRPDGGARTVGDVYRLLAGKFGARGDTAGLAALQELPIKERTQLRDAAERGIGDEMKARATQQQEQWNSWWNGFQLNLSNGLAGRSEIESAIQAGQLTDYKNIAEARKIVEKREGEIFHTTRGTAALQDQSTAWNPFNKEQKKDIDAVYESQKTNDASKNLGNGLNLWGKTRILAEDFATTLRGALISQDGGTMMRGLQVASAMLTTDPNAFASAGPAQEDLESRARIFNHKINGLGYNAREAAAQIAKMNDPEWKAKMKVKDEDLKKFREDILKNTGSSITDVFSDPNQNWFFNKSYSIGTGARERTAITNIFTELALDNYNEFGDRRLAISVAQQRMSAMFGVSNGVLRQFPPEKAAGYPALPDGTKSYIYTQAAADVFEKTGIKVDPKNITLVPIPYTAEAFRKGEPVPYAINFWKDVGGQQIRETVLRSDGVNPAPWVADYEKAVVGWRVETGDKMKALKKAQEEPFDPAKDQTNPDYGAPFMQARPAQELHKPPVDKPRQDTGPFPEGTIRFRRGPQFQSQAERKF